MQSSTPTPLERADAFLSRGHFDLAAPIYEELYAQSPDDVRLATRLGLVAEQQGEFARGASLMRQVLEQAPNMPGAHLGLANCLLGMGHPDQALTLFEALFQTDPGDVDALYRIGQCLLELDRPEEAEGALRRALELAPGSPEVLEFLGQTLLRTGRDAEAIECLQQAAASSPDTESIHRALGNAYLNERRFDDAVEAFDRAIAAGGETAAMHCNRGAALHRLRRLDEARDAFHRALELDEELPQAWNNLGNLLLEQNKNELARKHFEKGHALAPENSTLQVNLGRILFVERDIDAAEAHTRAVLERDPEFPQALEQMGSILLVRGEEQGSLDYFRRALEADPELASPHYRLAREGEITDPSGIERLLAQDHRTDEERMHLGFALGHVYERAGDHDRAFAAFQRGNELKNVRWDRHVFTARVTDILDSFGDVDLAALPELPPTPLRPIFVFGMIRSGTTLVEQIISTHGEVFGAGERHILERELHAVAKNLGTTLPYPQCVPELTDEQRLTLRSRYLADFEGDVGSQLVFTDKTPTNFQHLGILRALFPEARFVNCARDPRDSCLSAYFLNFHEMNSPYAYDLEHLAAMNRDYRRAVTFWREEAGLEILDVPYEELVADTETWTRRLLEFCNLEWDERCLRFHEDDRPVYTASASQVRKPTHTKSVAKWKRYEKHLGEFLAALER